MKIGVMYLNKNNTLIKIFVASATISSCSMLDTNRIAPGYIEAYGALSEYFSSSYNQIDDDIISRIPYASMRLRIGKGDEGLLILESRNLLNEYWVSADEVFLQIEDGRIVATKGLENNLIDNVNQIDLKALLSVKQFKTLVYMSYDQPALNNLKLDSSITVVGKEEVKLFSGLKTLTLIQEELSNDFLGWKVTNKYWIDEEGYCWKSQQNISPLLPTFYIEIAKKPA